MTQKQRADGKSLPADNVVPITPVLSQEISRFRQRVEQLQSELNQAKQENRTLRILNAQQQKDMEGMQKKYARVEQENKTLKEEKRVLLSSMKAIEAENQRLRRTIFGQSTEKMAAGGHEQSNTTALPEGTAVGVDEDTKETEMAENSHGGEKPSGNTSGRASHLSKGHRSGNGEKIPRPNNIRRQMENNLPNVHWYPLSPEMIRKLDKMYGRKQWRIMNWEGTSHLVHIPEMYVNQVDYLPVLCLKDGTLVRPFTEHPEEFPTSILPHSVLSSSEFANIIHKKFALGIPLYRQEKDLLQMCDIHLGRQDIADWIIRAGTRGFIQILDIHLLIDETVRHAVMAKEAGFDGVDIKACHGYFLGEMLSAFGREGEFGGSFENRTKALVQILDGIKEQVGDSLTLTVRLNAYDSVPYPMGWGLKEENGVLKPDLTEPVKLCGILRDRGVKIINITASQPEQHLFGKNFDKEILPFADA